MAWYGMVDVFAVHGGWLYIYIYIYLDLSWVYSYLDNKMLSNTTCWCCDDTHTHALLDRYNGYLIPSFTMSGEKSGYVCRRMDTGHPTHDRYEYKVTCAAEWTLANQHTTGSQDYKVATITRLGRVIFCKVRARDTFSPFFISKI